MLKKAPNPIHSIPHSVAQPLERGSNNYYSIIQGEFYMSWLDLHMHTNFSYDGTYSPEELMDLCLKNGVRVAAVADHNCTRGVLAPCSGHSNWEWNVFPL